MTADPSALATITEQIRRRRSIKPMDMDQDLAVSRELLLTLLENANYAPSHGMTEPWRFTIFQGAARQELADTLQRLYRETTPPQEFREDKMQKMGQNPLLASAIISIGMARRGGDKIPEIEEIEAVACAVQNLHLSASAAGLAGFWSSPPVASSPAFTQWLGLGPEDRCLGLFYIGWPKPGFKWPDVTRKPIDGKLQWQGEAS